ncbi:MAG: flippase-like domain-containing protein [Tannerella sp.]|jgi:uncharacterized protein (TIRG00374 family)|nr:flippase-like domain-containing protein [Tannerella sp.]
MSLKKIFRRSIRILLPLALGFGLLWYLYKDQDFADMMAVIRKGVRYDIILLSLIFGMLANLVRGYRWGLLIDSLGERVKRANVVLSVYGNYAINMALPRVGEIWRCSVVSKYSRISFSKLLGTMLVDRVMDTIVVAILTLSLFIFNISFFKQYFSANPAVLEGIYSMFTSVWMYVGLVAVGIVIWLLLTRWGHISVVQKGKGVILNVWEGIKSLWKMKHKVRFFFQTILIWGGYFCYFYLTFYAFDFTRDLGPRIGLIAFAMSSLGVAVPVQGGIGVWHFMVISTLICFGVKESDASSFALIVYTIQTMWVVLLGLFGIFALPIINKENPTDALSAEHLMESTTEDQDETK